MTSYFCLFTLVILVGCILVSAVDRPDSSSITGRVKPHRAGATGELVDGEEHLRKIIVQWSPVPGAVEYEICHGCTNIDDETGEETGDVSGKVISVGIGEQFTCGNRPCLVMPGAPLGYNLFHLRVKVGDEWSLWSEHRNFNIGDTFGTIEHEEL